MSESVSVFWVAEPQKRSSGPVMLIYGLTFYMPFTYCPLCKDIRRVVFFPPLLFVLEINSCVFD